MNILIGVVIVFFAGEKLLKNEIFSGIKPHRPNFVMNAEEILLEVRREDRRSLSGQQSDNGNQKKSHPFDPAFHTFILNLILYCFYLVKGRAFGSPLARGLKPRASTAEIPPGFAVLIREAMRAGKPGVSPSFMRLPNQDGALVAVESSFGTIVIFTVRRDEPPPASFRRKTISYSPKNPGPGCQ